MTGLVRTAAAALLLSAAGAAAQEVVEIVKRGATRSTIELSGLQLPDSPAGRLFRKTLASDLEQSGWFLVAPAGRGAVAVSGSGGEAAGQLDIACRVHGAAGGTVYSSRTYRGPASDAPRLAHAVADDIVQAVKQCRGFASTRLVLIGNRTGSKELYLCDADGARLVPLTRDRSICLSPAWAPDGGRVYYTSFAGQFPGIFAVDLRSAAPRRDRLTSFPGLNLCPAPSPDGSRLACVLSKDGNPDVYVMELRSRNLTRVTRTSPAAEASPAWSPDGRQIVFVSDSPGRPQLFLADRDGGTPRRLTYHGAENVAPDWGPGGQIAFCSLREGRYQIFVLDPASGRERPITGDGAHYEDPSWAPDGRHLVCARREGNRSAIVRLDTLDTAGGGLVRLVEGDGDWFSPVWSPR